LKEQGVEWIHLVQNMIECGLFWTRKWRFGFHKSEN